MRLDAAMALLDIFSGGMGSGCKGSNCGRPKSRYVHQQFTTPGGVRVTMVKPAGREHRWALRSRDHVFKGRFSKLVKHIGSGLVKPGQNLRTWTSEAKEENWSKHLGSKGATIFVHRYTDRKTGKPKETVVDEHNWVGHRWRYDAPVRRSFKNAGKAAGYIKRRYGLAVPLKEYIG